MNYKGMWEDLYGYVKQSAEYEVKFLEDDRHHHVNTLAVMEALMKREIDNEKNNAKISKFCAPKHIKQLDHSVETKEQN